MSNKPIIIGISGKIGSGKDTAAKLIAATLKSKGFYYVVRSPFAGTLKNVVRVITGVNMSMDHDSADIYMGGVHDYTQEQKEINVNGFTVGQLLQLVGVGLRNSVHENIWVDATINKINREFNDLHLVNTTAVFIIPDVRFPNEFEALREAGAILIRMEGDPGGVRKNSTRDLNHISEIALDHETRFHYTINTNEVDIMQMGVLLESITRFDVIENFLNN